MVEVCAEGTMLVTCRDGAPSGGACVCSSRKKPGAGDGDDER